MPHDPARRPDLAHSGGEHLSAPPRILVADDQPLHRDMLARAVDAAELDPAPQIVQASDGPEALHLLRDGVDVAFLDIRMPGMTGLEVLAIIRSERGPGVPIIVVSSSSDPRDVDAATRLGITAYIEKGRYPEFRAEVIRTLRGIWKDKRT